VNNKPASRPPAVKAGPRLGIDPASCAGVGICAHLAPRVVRIDSWGYPIIDNHALGRWDRRQASSAVAACPRRALFLDE
jgi:ferredoxin